MGKITVKDIPNLIPRINVSCPRCSKNIEILTQKIAFDKLEYECSNCGSKINMEIELSKLVDELNRMGIFKN